MAKYTFAFQPLLKLNDFVIKLSGESFARFFAFLTIDKKIPARYNIFE